MPKVQLDVPQETLNQLAKIATKPQDIVAAVALAALQEWANWLSGDFRPMSMSELETERIFKIYQTVLPDDLPSVDNLGKQLELPMGRARYIIQSLSYRQGRFLFGRQLREIARALKDGKWTGDTCVVVADRGCQLIIDRVLNDLLANKRITSTVTGVMTLDGIRYTMGKNHHSVLSEEIKRQLGDLPK